jgi:alkanesulfonate monooxygenase SsuD/methylene tetrahydromethanopterin reductase-like flavin-dependent oxidoreductase (luciferase family)
VDGALMPDYGHDLQFGVFVPPLAAEHLAVSAIARRADELGLELLGVQDHPYQPRFLDAWTLLANVARETEQIRLFPDVVNLPLRPPAVLARAAATLDVLSAGRVELGLGAGAFWDGVAAMGGERRTPGESVDALAEAVEVLRALWSVERAVTFEGKHYRLHGAQPGPAPVHRIGIVLGSYQPRMLALTGRVADGWVPSSAYLPPEQLGERSKRIDEAAHAAGRSPGEIRRVYNIAGQFQAQAAPGFLQGPPAHWVEQLAELALEAGISAFVLAVAPTGTLDAERFAEEVAPGVRAAVERGRTAPSAAERPVAVPAPPPPAATGSGQLLVQIHDHLRGELAQLREAIDAVEGGQRDPASLRSLLGRLTRRQNQCAVGSFCASYCRFVTIHHTIEDRRLFPDLRRRDGALAAALERLEREHEEIAEVLADLDDALADMLADESRLADVRAAVDRLAEQLLTHLTYEEEQLVGPMDRLGIVV